MGDTGHNHFDDRILPHFEALFRAAYRLTGNIADAEDLVQEVCVRAYPKLAEMEKLEYAKAWLLRVQYRVFVDGLRRRERSPLRPLSAEIEGSHYMISEEPGPEQHVDGQLASEQLQRAWTSLERPQQALLALHAEGYSLDDLQQMTGLSKNVLTARLHRARARLGKLLNSKTGEFVPLVQMEN